MAKVKAEVLNAVVGGKSRGEEIELSEEGAKHLEEIGYVKVKGKVAPKKQKAASQTKAKAAPKTKDDKTKE